MKVLVTGGGGFLGSRIVELLLETGHEVSFLARGRYPAVEARGARGLQVDLRDAPALTEAVRGHQAVLHVAAKAGFWGPRREFVSINLDGTRNVLAACRAAGVERLVYTSTPSVIGYAHEVNGLGHAPYPDRWESAYGETKARAEREVLAAHGPSLRTVALRPHLVIGPGDNHLLPRVVGRAREGRLFIVGDGKNLVDITYVDNAAWAHLDALQALADPQAACGGKAYFLSNDEPVVLWDWVNALLVDLGVAPLQRKVSLGTAQALGLAMEWAWTLLPLPGEPRMTRFLAAALARSHWYDMKPAREDFGYQVRVPLAEGTRRTVAWLKASAPAGA
jgi:nucleoside-diphosphate-sugar epimerase